LSISFFQRLGDVTVKLAEDNVVVLQSNRCNIIAAYIRPSSIENTLVLIDKITRAMQALPSLDAPLVVAGDFNARIDKP